MVHDHVEVDVFRVHCQGVPALRSSSALNETELVESGHQLVQVGFWDTLLPGYDCRLGMAIPIVKRQLHKGPHPIVNFHGDFHQDIPPVGKVFPHLERRTELYTSLTLNPIL